MEVLENSILFPNPLKALDMFWSLRKKILLGYGLILLLLFVVFVWALYELRTLGEAGDAILRKNYRSILAAEKMTDALGKQNNAFLLVTQGFKQEGLQEFHENESSFLQWLGRAKDNITEEGEGEILQQIDTKYVTYISEFSKLIDLYFSEPSKSSHYYRQSVLPQLQTVREKCDSLSVINERAMYRSSAHAREVADKSILSLMVIGMAALGFGLLFSLVLSTIIIRPVKLMIGAVKKVSEGDYSLKLPVKTSDEIGFLSGEFNEMATKLKSYNDMNIRKIVAEKQKSEAIILGIIDGIIVVDGEFKIININPLAADLFDVEPEKSLGKHFLEIVKDETLFGYIRHSAETELPLLFDEENNVVTVNQGKSVSYYAYSIMPFYIEGENQPGVVVLLHDITRLKELDRLKSEFVMMASHELRTPLTSIGMSIDLLREKATPKLNDKEKELLSVAFEESQRLRALVNDLLDLSRIEAGKIEMEFTSVPVLALFEKAVSPLKTQVEERSIELSYEIQEHIPRIKADSGKIIWVIVNLIANALRYTDKGGHISLRAEKLGAFAQISVQDDGMGIPYEYQSRIFDKFVQVKGAREEGGSGLGLSISREIVRAHGGAIWVESTPGKGSTFTFTIPLAEEQAG
jgi:two-component system, NtrC family, sensor histidine kinase KinB